MFYFNVNYVYKWLRNWKIAGRCGGGVLIINYHDNLGTQISSVKITSMLYIKFIPAVVLD